MKYILDEILHTLSQQEIRQFKYFLKRNNNHKQEREDIALIEDIRKKEHAALKINAHNQTRGRVRKQLEQFISIENIRHDEVARVHNMIEVARFLFRRNLHIQAWHYIEKAEQIATDMNEYELLDYIYYIQITYSSGSASNMPAANIPDLLNKREQNLLLARTDGDANAAYALLIHEISENFSRSLDVDMDTLVNRILKRYQLENKIYDSPKIYLKIVNIVCKALRANNAYEKLKNYALYHYDIIDRKKILHTGFSDDVMNLLFGIYTASLQTKDYGICEKFLDLYATYAENFKTQEDKYLIYYFKSNIIRSDFYICTGRLNEAKETLLSLYTTYVHFKHPLNSFILLRINLAAVHFKHREYALCIKFIAEIIQQDRKTLIKIDGIGVELMLFTEMYNAMMHYENNDADYACHILNTIKRNYGNMLNERDSKRERIFIRIMEKILNDASYFISNEFRSDHDEFIKLKEYMPGDKEYISLNAWLTSKLTGKTYYECFLEIIN